MKKIFISVVLPDLLYFLPEFFVLLRFMLIGCLCSPTWLWAENLVSFNSAEGQLRLTRAEARADLAPLLNQFEPQRNKLFCGPTSMAIVLNALQLPPPPPQALPDLPADRMLARFDSDNVISGHPKTRGQVLGEPILIQGKMQADYGYQLKQLAQQLQQHGAVVSITVVDQNTPPAQIRQQLIRNLQQNGDFVIVNYQRKALGQNGGGHISPLAAYDPNSDSFLILDVNPSQQPWVWVNSETLIKAMATFDTVENRGFLQVSHPK